jgi:hypothetical protein
MLKNAVGQLGYLLEKQNFDKSVRLLIKQPEVGKVSFYKSIKSQYSWANGSSEYSVN